MLVTASVLAGIFLAQDHALKTTRAALATTTASLATCQAERERFVPQRRRYADWVDQGEGQAVIRPALIVLTAALTAGCATHPSCLPPIETKVQVSVPCDPDPVPAPAFPVDGLTGDEDIFTKVQTLAADIETREGYEARLKAAVDACRP